MVDSKEMRVMRWKRGETPGPWRMFIFPTYRCNLECGYCSQALVDDPPELLKEIPDERLLQIIDEAAELGVRDVFIGGGGEPMLRRKVVMEMIRRVRAHGMNGTLQSNGTAFRPEDLETLVSIGWQFLSISVDGPDRDTNDGIRYQGSFDKLTKHLRMVRDLKAKYGAKTPFVQIATVVTAKNCHLLPQMVELGKELGVDRVHFLSLWVKHEGMDAYIVDEEHRARIQAGAEKAQALADTYGIQTNAINFEEQRPEGEPWVWPEAHPERQDKVEFITESPCYDPWLSLSIVSSGNSGPCCNFWEGHSNNIKEHSLKEIWLGPYLSEMRNSMLTNDPPEPCRECQVDLIRHNRGVAANVAALHAEHEVAAATPARLVAKALRSVQRHGMKNSMRRGREWLILRRSLAHK